MKNRVARRLPDSEAATKSLLRILRRRTLRASTAGADGWLPLLRDPRELVTTLRAPTREHIAPGCGAHPGAETVIACAPDSAGLERAFHQNASRAERLGGRV